MRLCLPARMGGGGKAESTPWRGPAGAQRSPLGGGYSALGTRGQSPWRSRLTKKRGRQAPSAAKTELPSSLSRNAAPKSAPLHGAKPAGWCARAIVRQRPSGHERGKSASGSGRKRRPLTGLPGQSASARTPAPLNLLLIVTRMGRDFRPGSRQRIEQVARRVAGDLCCHRMCDRRC